MGPRTERAVQRRPHMFAVLSSMAPGVVYYNQVRIPPLPSGDWLRLRDGLSLLEEQTDATTRSGDLASVGGTVWPAAASLCAWLREHAADVAGASVLELGSGTGACGLYAAALGARRVVLTDGREGLRPLQEDNIRRNAPLMRAGTLVTSETLSSFWEWSVLVQDSIGCLAGSWGAVANSRRMAPPCVILQRRTPPRLLSRRWRRGGRIPGRRVARLDDPSGFMVLWCIKP